MITAPIEALSLKRRWPFWKLEIPLDTIYFFRRRDAVRFYMLYAEHNVCLGKITRIAAPKALISMGPSKAGV